MDLTSVGCTDCSVSALNVHERGLTSARITDSRLHHVDIPTVSAAYVGLQRLAFDDTEVVTLHVSGAILSDVELRTVDLPKITGLGHPRGATINHIQLQQPAPAMAAQLGIDVER